MPRGLLDEVASDPTSTLASTPNQIDSSPDVTSTRTHASSSVRAPARATRVTKARYGRDRKLPDSSWITRSRARTTALPPMELESDSSNDDSDNDMDMAGGVDPVGI